MAAPHHAPAPVPAPRLVSLDAFRGAIIALMVLVNTAGSFSQAYAPLLHAEWHGWTLTDTVFPSFVWIVGLSLTLSLAKRATTCPRGELIGHILKRGAILYALGLFLYGFPTFDLGTWRVLGVLQRIAICYVAASIIFLSTGVRGQIIWTAGLLAAYTALMFGPGGGRFDVAGNFAHYVDNLVLGAHNYRETATWDPEGIVSTLPAIATAVLGVLAGQFLRAKKASLFVPVGAGLVVAAALCDAFVMPINKKLWTVSFTLLMAGLDFLVLAVMMYVVDTKGLRAPFRPFVILGMNAIAVYMISELLETVLSMTGVRMAIYNAAFAPWLPADAASLCYSLTYVLLMFAIAYGMYRRNWFLRV